MQSRLTLWPTQHRYIIFPRRRNNNHASRSVNAQPRPESPSAREPLETLAGINSKSRACVRTVCQPSLNWLNAGSDLTTDACFCAFLGKSRPPTTPPVLRGHSVFTTPNFLDKSNVSLGFVLSRGVASHSDLLCVLLHRSPQPGFNRGHPGIELCSSLPPCDTENNFRLVYPDNPLAK